MIWRLFFEGGTATPVSFLDHAHGVARTVLAWLSIFWLILFSPWEGISPHLFYTCLASRFLSFDSTFCPLWSAGYGLTFPHGGLVKWVEIDLGRSPHHSLKWSLFLASHSGPTLCHVRLGFPSPLTLGNYSWESRGNHGRIMLCSQGTLSEGQAVIRATYFFLKLGSFLFGVC